ncbi:CPBP family intramembrane glutamic endopeptidase [Maritimibacter sp. DP1N21-5]|uniref:CPBP family intramembrane glutamic endopeptidase n=1 Tax=Maritimibacter sp. DP1N21-5 TaxID=2836867 RepID=UPI001C45A5EC|nr:type II CAAX endopeptidase family protein [Maritimibacter sp. DP1N21-5]MBV7408347.1 CPBP family intramembrane metalloprotease [Maritimibacter sp. DP1N21-5]
MQSFWEPALPRVQIWRTVLGFALLIGIFFAATAGVFQLGAYVTGAPPRELVSALTPQSTLLFFLTFIGFHLGLLIVLPLLHKRWYPSLFGPSRRINMAHFGWGVLATVALATFLYAFMYVDRQFLDEEFRPRIVAVRPLSEWLVWLLPALAVIFLQTFAEEAVFRGYLLQQLRGRFRSPLIWAVLPSLIFGLLHFDPGTYGYVNAGAYVINTTTTGVLLCLITIRTGNIGAAAGLHFGNNAALIFIGIKGNLEGFSLFAVEMGLESGYTAWSILSQTGFTLVLFAIWWRWMNRRDAIAKPALAA